LFLRTRHNGTPQEAVSVCLSVMPKCGVCGWSFSERTLTKHAETACGEEDIKAGRCEPELDDLIRMEEEFYGK